MSLLQLARPSSSLPRLRNLAYVTPTPLLLKVGKSRVRSITMSFVAVNLSESYHGLCIHC